MFLRANRRSTSPQRSQDGARAVIPQAQPARPPLGNQAMQHLLRSGAIQAKLTVNQPGDRFEQEADQVAESVMRSAAPGAPLPAVTPVPASGLQRKCEHCAAEEGEEKEGKHEVQREAAAPGPAPAAA
jgi:hypothetical protein